MTEKYNDSMIPKSKTTNEFHDLLVNVVKDMPKKVDNAMNEMQFSVALEEIRKVIKRANKYVDETIPWKLAKDENSKEKLDCVLYDLGETLRIVTVMISPPRILMTALKTQSNCSIKMVSPHQKSVK